MRYNNITMKNNKDNEALSILRKWIDYSNSYWGEKAEGNTCRSYQEYSAALDMLEGMLLIYNVYSDNPLAIEKDMRDYCLKLIELDSPHNVH